ncbi:hypothetical protein CGLO_14702 [Colletotrichum gloeosporioides Cg-14]|uniref:Uncharacterized protein n=1 Tax=Colletotrichum gloeosporioides (strain Cg-14) TaxID=1237896 RepID=T0JT21_COLGC|nr:hypothetical protein CGLO_14702 [Colletotrichum gloeosporioides Cg-14]
MTLVIIGGGPAGYAC